MSLFGGYMDDPIFGHMNSMFNPFIPFGGMMTNPFSQQLAIQDPTAGSLLSRMRAEQHRHSLIDPFVGMGGLLDGGMMGGMARHMRLSEQNPNSHMYSQSSVVSFDNTGTNPGYHKTTKSVRKIGDIKEVQRTVRDSQTGQEQATIEQYIGKKGVGTTKKRNRNGKITTSHKLFNMSKADQHNFNQQYAARTRRDTLIDQLALDSSEDAQGPIVEFPDDDLSDDSNAIRNSKPRAEIFVKTKSGKGKSRKGPIVELPDDDSADDSNTVRNSKPGAGIFGKTKSGKNSKTASRRRS